MSLRLRLNLAIALLSLAFVSALAALQVEATRRSVREEVQASHRIAAQLLAQIGRVYAYDGTRALLAFLSTLGRVRANDLTVTDDAGHVLYRSPPSAYRPGQEAPGWFAALVAPQVQPRDLRIEGATLRIAPDASRAVLDGWDDVRWLLGGAGSFVLLVMGAVAWLVSRATAPFARIEQALAELERGHWTVRLPPVQGREATRIRDAFNRVASAIPEQMAARAAEAAAREQLAASRAFGERLQARIEQERAMLARELHDEFGQSVTAIRSLATAIGRRAGGDAVVADAAAKIADIAGHSYAEMQQLIGRLRPMALDTLGLEAALEDLAARWQAQPDAPSVRLHTRGSLAGLAPAVSLAAFRIVQEALGNAVRHARAASVQVSLRADAQGLSVRVDDDGCGLGGPACRGAAVDALHGGFGLSSMRERAEALGGRFHVGAPPGRRGTRVEAWLPVAGARGEVDSREAAT